MSLTPAHYLPLQLNRYHQNPSSQFPLWGLGSWPSTSLSWRGHKLLFFHTLDILIILHWVRCVVVLTEIPQPQIRSQISPQSQIALGRILNGSHLFSDKPCVFPMSFFFHLCSQAPILCSDRELSVQIRKIFFYQQVKQTFTFVLQIIWVFFGKLWSDYSFQLIDASGSFRMLQRIWMICDASTQ